MKQYMTERFSVKKFDSTRKLPEEQISELIECFRLSPSSLNLQAWKLVVVSDENMKNKLADAGIGDNGPKIKDCSHLFVLVRKKLSLAHFQKVIESTEMLQLKMKKQNMNIMKMKAFFFFYSLLMGQKNWAVRQVYLALGVLLASCAKMGIGSLPMEGIRWRKMDKILGLSGEYRTVVALALGFPHEREATNPSRLKKSRFSREEVTLLI
jgi:nitroreductase/dihydropteridine reductase